MSDFNLNKTIFKALQNFSKKFYEKKNYAKFKHFQIILLVINNYLYTLNKHWSFKSVKSNRLKHFNVKHKTEIKSLNNISVHIYYTDYFSSLHYQFS